MLYHTVSVTPDEPALSALLALVDQVGAACHTGRRSCFYRAARDGV
jgi:phosphoribosyl-AMP cyclohydrolase